MTVINEDYMYLIIKKISNLHDIPIEGSINRLDYNKVYNRAGLIFALEVVLEEHRNTYATSWSPLKGKIALQHLLLVKYKWTLDVIKMLKLPDIIMLLQEELNYNKLPGSAQKILNDFRANKLVDYFPTISDAEWDPDLIEQMPETIQW